MQKLVLWDVDRTLLHTDGIAGKVMHATMVELFGPVTRRERTFYSGKTDWRIIQETFPELSEDFIGEQMARFCVAYTHNLEQRRNDLLQRSATMHGVVDVLQRLHGTVVQAPLTGNIAAVARIKLDVLNLLPYVNHEIGAYGDDHYQRTRLVPIAAERAARVYGHPFEGRDVVIVGDTPHDISCGKANDARTVAVATGPYSVDELLAHEPDVVLEDLRDTEKVVAAIVGM
jgi:phosphoglycolate phosphatase